MNLTTRISALACSAALLALPAAAATTITLQDGLSGYAGTTDTWLDASQLRENHGGATNLRVQWNGGHDDCVLVRFDLTGKIPNGAAVLSAELWLYYTAANAFATDNAVTLKPYRLQPGAWWDENIFDGQFAGASFSYRDAGEVLQWTGGADGGWADRVDDGDATVKIKGTGGTPGDAIAPQTWAIFDVTPTLTNWRFGVTNNGFLVAATALQGTAGTVYGTFTSRNDAGATLRPKLTITFEPPVRSSVPTWGRIKGLYR
jgi:hypothetical protein